MTAFTFSHLLSLLRSKWARAILVCALVLPVHVSAQEAQDNERQHQLEEKTSTELEKLKPLLDAKNWDGALALLQALKPKVKPDSYDMAIITDVEAKLYLQKSDFVKGVEAWEQTIRLSDQFNYFAEDAIQEMIYTVAQVYYQEATAPKVTPAAQKQNFAKSVSYLERWMAKTKKPDRDTARQEAQLFYANVLYNQAVIDPENIDKALIDKAEAEAEKGLKMTAHPKDTFYLILLAIAQQKNNMPRLAELLELLVKMSPAKKDYWSQLGGVYLNLAGQEKDEKKAKEYNTRAILAIERAQTLGFMKTPKENYTLVGIYFNVGQFGRATEILHAGLRDGSIDNESKNWELLAYSYQQVDRPLQAI